MSHKIKNRVTIEKCSNGKWALMHMTFDNGRTVWHNVVPNLTKAEAQQLKRSILSV